MTIDEVLPDPADAEPEAPNLTGGKANFDSIYNSDDPREYYGELGSLGYEIPQHGYTVFSQILDVLQTEGAPAPTVLDLCCSYGVNAALLRADVTMADLIAHYRSPEMASLSAAEVAAADEAWFKERRRPTAPSVAGLDISELAVRYAERVGLLSYGAVENLEEVEPSKELGKVMANADLVTVTGGIGYITAKTIQRLYDQAHPDRMPWLAAFCLRRYSFHDIEDVLASKGMITERLKGWTFPQRAFHSDEEREFTIRHLDEAALEIDDREGNGHFHTDFFLVRPAEQVHEVPLPQLLPGLARITEA